MCDVIHSMLYTRMCHATPLTMTRRNEQEYLKMLGVPYFYESHGIIEQASCSLQKTSICRCVAYAGVCVMHHVTHFGIVDGK